jgi:hypothetical protein
MQYIDAGKGKTKKEVQCVEGKHEKNCKYPLFLSTSLT